MDAFTVQGSKWSHKNLTWVYLNSTYFNSNQTNFKLSSTEVRTAIYHSLQQWEKISVLTFNEDFSNANADIKISFVTGDHNDGYNFDGRGRVLAHAFYPSGGMKGVVHLDNDEDWDMDFLKRVLVHELGHTFGLSHSSDNSSIMFPWYSSSVTNLNSDDKNGIEAVYGMKNKWDYNPYGHRGHTTTTPKYDTTRTPRIPYTIKPVQPVQPTFPIRPRISKPLYPIVPKQKIPTFLNIVNSSISNLYVFFSPDAKSMSMYNLTNLKY